MRASGEWLRRPIAICLVIGLAAPFAAAAAARQQPAQPGPSVQGAHSVPAPPQNSDPAIAQNQPSGTAQPTPEPQQNGASKPVGAAAAPYEKTTGVAASRPAGAVIAPAKQRRTRSFLIKVAVIVGAAVAIGTVAALSKSSPSRPN